MTINIGTLSIDLVAAFDDFHKDMKKVGDEVADTKKKFDDMSGGLSKLAIGFGAVAAAGGLVITKMVGLASGLDEARNVVKETFGADQVKAVEEWASAFARGAGRSRVEATKMVGAMNAMLGPQVKNAELSGEMSKKLTELSADLGSFFDAADTDVFAALKSGMLGSTEPMQRFAVDLKASSLQAFMLSKGMKGTIKNMSEAEKMHIRYLAILDQTKAAQGDAVRTIDGFANAQKNLETSVQDLSAAIGGTLTPIFAPLMSAAADLVRTLADAPPVFQKIAGYSLLIGTALAGLIASVAAFALSWGAWLSIKPLVIAGFIAMKGAAIAAGVALKGAFVSLATFIAPLLVPLAAIALAVAAIGIAFFAVKRAVEQAYGPIDWAKSFDEAIETVKGTFTLFVDIIKESLASTGEAAKGFWMYVEEGFVGLFGGLLQDAKNFFMPLITGFEKIRTVGGEVASDLGGYFKDAFTFIKDFALKPFKDLFDLLNKGAAVLAGLSVGASFKEIKELLADLEETGDTLFDDAADTLKQGGKDFVRETKRGLKNAAKGFQKIFDEATEELVKGSKKAGEHLETAAKTTEKEFLKAANHLADAVAKVENMKIADFKAPGGGATTGGGGPNSDAGHRLGEMQNQLLSTGEVFTGALMTLAQNTGDLGKLMMGVMQGFQTGGFIGAIVEAALQLLMLSDAFENAVEIMNSTVGMVVEGLEPIFKIFEDLAQWNFDATQDSMAVFGEALEAVGSILSTLFDMLDDILTPLKDGLEQLLASLLDGLAVFAQLFENFGEMSGLLWLVTKALQAVGWLLNGLSLGFAYVHLGLIKLGNGFIDFLNWLDFLNLSEDIARIDASGVEQRIEDLKEALSTDPFADTEPADLFQQNTQNESDPFTVLDDLSSQAEDLGSSFDDVGAATDSLAESLLNVPTGFKVARARFNATVPGLGDTPAASEDMATLRVENLYIETNDPSDFFSALRDRGRMQSLAEAGIAHDTIPAREVF